MICVLADENIAGLDAYLACDEICLIKGAGRQLTDMMAVYRPDALLIRSVTPINKTTLANNHSVRFVGTATLGIDHVDTAFLHNSGIGFAHAAGSSKHSVAQYVLSAVATLRFELMQAGRSTTLGIVGLGHIGATLVDYARELGWQVAGYDPWLPPSMNNNSDLPAVLQSDVISLHTPLVKEGAYPTYHLINKQRLELIPKDSLLINAARGAVVDNHALRQDMAQTARQVVLDVFEDEPFVPNSLLDKLSLATPHIAGYSLDAKLRGTDMIYQALCRYFALPIRCQLSDVLPPNPYRWQMLKQAWQQGKNLKFYDIYQDDSNLRQACDEMGVSGGRFDELRKNYPLKREWLV